MWIIRATSRGATSSRSTREHVTNSKYDRYFNLKWKFSIVLPWPKCKNNRILIDKFLFSPYRQQQSPFHLSKLLDRSLISLDYFRIDLTAKKIQIRSNRCNLSMKNVLRNFAQILRILSKKKKTENTGFELFNLVVSKNHAETSSFVQHFIIRSYSYERKPSFLESREISKTILPLYFSVLFLP